MDDGEYTLCFDSEWLIFLKLTTKELRTRGIKTTKSMCLFGLLIQV